tara:strand:+ start:388 stop:615 length:228 start_codon:yes stop_codon:yes gene_type:complete
VKDVVRASGEDPRSSAQLSREKVPKIFHKHGIAMEADEAKKNVEFLKAIIVSHRKKLREQEAALTEKEVHTVALS